MMDEILKFYKQTSMYTDLGFYKDFAKELPDDIGELCDLQRKQIIHPFDLSNENELSNANSFYGDMRIIDKTSLCFENDVLTTAQALLAELLRRNKFYTKDRPIEDKIHVCCREQAILLASILKAKGISARVRSGFARYVCFGDEEAGDHWITEHYNEEQQRWILVDADMYFDDKTKVDYGVDFDLIDIPRKKFIFGAEAYLALRKKQLLDKEIAYASSPRTYGLDAALHGLFYDFHSLMNNEVIFLHLPKYVREKNFKLSEEEYRELDELATLMLMPDENFSKIIEIWDSVDKFRILSGGMN